MAKSKKVEQKVDNGRCIPGCKIVNFVKTGESKLKFVEIRQGMSNQTRTRIDKICKVRCGVCSRVTWFPQCELTEVNESKVGQVAEV